jgi:flotillin
VAKTTADAESAIKEAEGQAEATRRIADAQMYKAQKAADAVLYQQLKAAKCTLANLEAQADGLSRFLSASGERPDLAKFQLALQSGLFEKMATTTADAVRGMEPKIHIWTTGGGSDADSLAPLRNIFASIPPMLDAVKGQTNFRAPEWLAGPRKGSPEKAAGAAPGTPPVSSVKTKGGSAIASK